jgi:hypothetical protein
MNASIEYFFDPVIDSEQDILAIRCKAMELIRLGIVTMDWAGEGTEGKREFTAPVVDVLRATAFCLKQKNPRKYGALVRQSQVIRTM